MGFSSGLLRVAGFLALAFVAGTGSLSAAVGTPISFQNLPVGDTIEVTFESSGCFHHVTYFWNFRRSDKGNVTARVRGESGNAEIEAKMRGEGVVSSKDLAGLDRLLEYYRAGRPGGCTTVNTITLVWSGGIGEIAREKYVDGTCGTYDNKKLVLFSNLLAKLREKGK